MKIRTGTYIFKFVSDMFVSICKKIMLTLQFLLIIPENPFLKLSSCANVLYYILMLMHLLYITHFIGQCRVYVAYLNTNK